MAAFPLIDKRLDLFVPVGVGRRVQYHGYDIAAGEIAAHRHRAAARNLGPPAVNADRRDAARLERRHIEAAENFAAWPASSSHIGSERAVRGFQLVSCANQERRV
jgi:hypothetical protein